jgi:hypothetical protein
MGVLAVAAVIMTVRAERLTPAEKRLWILIAFLLFVVEIRAIRRDRAEHDREQTQALKEERANFSDILTQEQQHFAETIRGLTAVVTQNQQQFGETVKRTNAVLANITGGNSYGVVLPLIGVGRSDADIPLAIENHGQNILNGVSVTLYDTGIWIAGTHNSILCSVGNRINVGTLYPGERLVLSALINPEQFMQMDAGERVFRVFVYIAAQNFTSTEYLDFKRGKENNWTFRYAVYRQSPSANTSVHRKKPGVKEHLLEAADWSSNPNEPVNQKRANASPD